MSRKRKILYAVLDWGLGHATRSLPIIRQLVTDNDVTVLSTGRSRELLKAELPGIEFIDYPDYSVRYTERGGTLLLSLCLQLPKIFIRLRDEHKFTERLVAERKFDRIVSDNRYGIYSNSVPSFFITHQLRFKLNPGLEKLEFISEYFNRFYFRHYKKIFIPDEEKEPNLSGDLSHGIRSIKNTKLHYTGILADLNPDHEPVNSDYLIIISGPEPQRTIFEKKAIEQSSGIQGKIIIVCGKTESSGVRTIGNTEIYDHASRKVISSMIKGTGMIISRPGYSGVMEIVSMNKKALFIPTPGQTEQEYLGRYFKDKGYFHSVIQEKMDLQTDIKTAENFKCPVSFNSNNISGLLDEILS